MTPDRAAIRAEAERLRALLMAGGAAPIETDVLQDAGPLLDLYGEDIRARAYVTWDPLRGERMLRPDFTVPVARAHMEGGATPARYAYAGEVFRRQEEGADRPTEFLQVGLEVFDAGDPAARDAEVLAAILDALGGVPARAAIGDMGLVMAAVRGLGTSERRVRALLRHVWRPRKFRALLARFGGEAPTAPHHARLAALADPGAAIVAGGAEVGRRTAADVAERLAALRAEAAEPPIGAREIGILGDLLALRAPAVDALSRLRDFAVDMPAIAPAIAAFAARLGALEARGIDAAALPFEGSLGRATMEYYDGFVFDVQAEGRPDLPPLASGGRYDALTAVLGGGAGIPAVGGVIRPAALLEARA